MQRPTFHEYLLGLAMVASKRATCSKRQVGAVIADSAKQILALSYNGVPAGQPHCIDAPCKGLTMSAPASHQACRAIHAESNALVQAGRTARGGTMAITTSPCLECAKLIANSGITTLILGDLNRLWASEDLGVSPQTVIALAGINIVFISPNSF